MDAFYASVEQRDNPELRDRPVAVDGSRERGVVAAAGYEARKFGVRSAVPSVTARRQCPDLVFAKPPSRSTRRSADRSARTSPNTRRSSNRCRSTRLTWTLRRTCSASRWHATSRWRSAPGSGPRPASTPPPASPTTSSWPSWASDQRKPNGQFVISPEKGLAFVENLAAATFHGIGPATAARFHALEIQTGLDIRGRTLAFLEAHFGKAGAYYYWISRGIDERPVRVNRIRKSIGAENTFFQDLTEFDAMVSELQPLVDKVWRHCENTGHRGRTVTLKVKFADFEIISRSRSVPTAVGGRDDLERLAVGLLEAAMPLPKAVRLLGVLLSSLQFSNDGEQRQIAFQI